MTIREFRARIGFYLGELASGKELEVAGQKFHATSVCTKSNHKINTVYQQPTPEIENGLDKRQTSVYQAIDKVSTCDRCKKNPPQRKIEEDGEDYKVCEPCLKKSFPMNRIKRMPLFR